MAWRWEPLLVSGKASVVRTVMIRMVLMLVDASSEVAEGQDVRVTFDGLERSMGVSGRCQWTAVVPLHVVVFASNTVAEGSFVDPATHADTGGEGFGVLEETIRSVRMAFLESLKLVG